ncbi:MAG: DUF4325 domain-containing protein [Betaproteobacteria bacterium]|nr:DUF4325 domain-containing protein [Betaproteobacteria bacterium]
MTEIRQRSESIRRFIIDNLQKHPSDIVRVTAEKFACTRQAIHKHLQKLLDEKAITQEGRARNTTYRLAPLVNWYKEYPLGQGITEDQVWREDIASLLGKLPENVFKIWNHGFTEMFNNVIDHSDAKYVVVRLWKNAATTVIQIEDDGIGIFKKIQTALHLLDERHAVLELAKGKFTTDPDNHSGEGIFFTSRMFDDFHIESGKVHYTHAIKSPQEDWIIQIEVPLEGTLVEMALHNHTARTTKKIFDQFASGEDYGFSKTIVPVKLVQYGDDNLVSRSQAKRLLARFDRFKVVVLDFTDVASIGQAFADEVFRVFKLKHPGVELVVKKANADVKRMISRAEALAAERLPSGLSSNPQK